MPSALSSARSAAASSRAAWLLRWLVLLVIVWDQAGSPLHHHPHDAGMDTRWLGAVRHDAMPALAHAAHGDEDLGFAHAVLAVRPKADLDAVFIGDDPVEEISAPLLLPLARPFAALHPVAAGDLAPPRLTHRSLPPAGRAPPLST